MSATGLRTFDETLHATNAWLHEIESRMGWEDRRAAYRLLRVSLHAIRDRLPVQEAAHLAAQLPLLLRGVYYEGWRPSDTPKKTHALDDFLAGVADAFSDDPDFDTQGAFREVLDVMRRHVSEGEMEDVRRSMPERIRPLWDDDAP